MNDDEKRRRNQGAAPNRGGPCWGPGAWAECCPGMGNANSSSCNGMEMPRAMARCFRSCRYFLLFPVILGIIFLVYGYYLSPEASRALWMMGAGMVAAMALFGVLVARRMTAESGFSGCRGTRPRRNTKREGTNDEFNQ